jgi:hypothetical protein
VAQVRRLGGTGRRDRVDRRCGRRPDRRGDGLPGGLQLAAQEVQFVLHAAGRLVETSLQFADAGVAVVGGLGIDVCGAEQDEEGACGTQWCGGLCVARDMESISGGAVAS